MVKKKYFGIFFIMMVISECYCQDTKKLFSINNDSLKPIEWKAKWIWLDNLTNKENNIYMLARKTFQIESIPKNARLYITASDHYKLWINGEFINRGPARCDPHHQSYDVLEIAPLLKTGKNAIVVQVHYHGIMRSYYNDPYPGLLVQLELNKNSGKEYINSDRTWKLKKDIGLDSRNEWVNSANANNFSTCYNFNLAPAGWRENDYDDTSWSNASYQKGPFNWPGKEPDYEPYAIQQPWYELVARDLPPLEEHNEDISNIFEISESPQYSKYKSWNQSETFNAKFYSMQDVQKPLFHNKVENAENFLKGMSPLIVKNSVPDSKFTKEPLYHTTIIFDFGKIKSGYPYLIIKGNKGDVIDVNYIPYLLDSLPLPGVLVENFSDRIFLSGEVDNWETTELRTLRYMSVTIRSNKEVSINRGGVRVEEYPFKTNGYAIVAEEPFIKDFWEAGEKTIRTITTDAFTDNYHERRQYVQTSYYASGGNYASFGDTYLQRRYLVQHAQNQLHNGIMPMWEPWGIYSSSQQIPGIFEANHFWLMGLHDYYLFTGDEKTTRELLVNAERCANAINQIQFKDNLIFKPPYPYWIDWAKLAQGDQNFIINALQMKAFRDYAELLKWLGESELSNKWNGKADQMVESLKMFWCEEKGLFAENINKGVPDENYSEHANALAIVVGIADKNQTKIIIEKILKNDIVRIMEESVLFNYWVAEAIFSQGYTKEGIDFLKKRYQHMVYDKEIASLWEYANLYAQNSGKRESNAPDEWGPRSWAAAQGENCFPPSTLSHWVLGLQPSAPGLKEVSITTLSSPYNSLKGSLLTPNGMVSIIKQGKILELELPTSVKARISLSELNKLKGKTIHINNKQYVISELKEDLMIDDRKNKIEIR